MLIPRFVVCTFSVGILVTGTGVVSGQDYPYKPIRIVTAAAGGGNDFQARIIAPGISGPLGQPVIVENKANGVIAAEIASKAPPDGYTLHLAGGALWLTPMLQKAPYDASRDFTPITMTVREVFIAAVHPSLPVNSIQELIALAKAKPGQLNFSTDSTGARSHLSTEILKSMAGINMVRVAYKGGAAAITALMSNEVQFTIFDAAIILPQMKAGKLRGLAVTSAEPTVLVPGLPSIASAGLPGYESVGMTGVFAQTKTPPAIINRLNREMVRVLILPDVKEKFFSAGIEVIASSPEALDVAMKADIGRMSKAIKDAGIVVN